MKLSLKNIKSNRYLIYGNFDLISYKILNRVNEYEVYYKIKHLIFDKISGQLGDQIRERTYNQIKKNIDEIN